MITLQDLTIDPIKAEKMITKFIKKTVEEAGLNGAIVAVSGGIDSAVVLSLTVKALGPKRVTALTLPERDITPMQDIDDVMQLVTELGLTCDCVDTTQTLRVMRESLPLYSPSNRVAFGNVKARTRMIIVYHYANTLNRMVVGTSNKSELYTGYFTKYGDSGVDIMPIGDLYKNQVRQLALHLNLPEQIIKKVPTAGFWPGQTDEGELGIDYDSLDLILYAWSKGFEPQKIVEETGVPIQQVEMILRRVRGTEHKRRPPTILRLSKAPI
jgi:NAD+ synthase